MRGSGASSAGSAQPVRHGSKCEGDGAVHGGWTGACMRVAFVVAFSVLAGSNAFAGAWTMSKGKGQVIVSGFYTEARQGFDHGGRRDAVPPYSKSEIYGLVEYGVTDWFTAIAQSQLQGVTIGEPVDAERFGLGYTDIGARMRFWSNEDAVVSGQLIGRYPGTGDDGNPAAVGNTEKEVDARLLGGYGFQLGTWPSFADAELAYRFRFGDPPDEVRADLTFGTRPYPKLLLLAQSFSVLSTGRADGVFETGSYHKVQLSGVYDVSRRLSLQLGAIATVAGENALAETGLMTAVWFRF